MISVSATARAEEEFGVAVTARNRGGKDLDLRAALRCRKGRDIVADLSMHGGIADDAALAMLSLRLELRLDQRQQMHPGGGKRQRRPQQRLQRDEADVGCG